ncbi:MAG: alpha/beta fold hydrolase, partial [Pseudomonadota bacterium]
MRSDFIEAGGLRFHCLIGGDASKPLLLMLHGFPEYSGGYEELIERLSADYYCVAPDQRGYNTSDKPEGVGEYVAGKLAEDAAAILQHFAPKARAVIGHDWGASVAYALVFKRPDLMKKFVILNGAHPVPFQRAQLSNPDQAAASAYIHYLRSEKAEARLS